VAIEIGLLGVASLKWTDIQESQRNVIEFDENTTSSDIVEE
jgi:hypothetical protein